MQKGKNLNVIPRVPTRRISKTQGAQKMAGIDALKKFYVFVQAKGGWGAVSSAADNGGNKNGVVDKQELNKYLQDNFVDYEAHDFESIWAHIDTVRTGNITKGVENLGALDDGEAGKIQQQAEKFEDIINALKAKLNGLGLNFTSISNDDLLYTAAAILAGENHPDLGDTHIEQVILHAALSVIPQVMLKNLGKQYANGLKDIDGGKYVLSEDKNLTDIINNYIGTITNINQLNNVENKVKDIIVAYLATAGLIWEYQAPNDLESNYQYGQGDPNAPINNLQKARLLTAFEAALKTNSLADNPLFNEFTDFADALKQTVSIYLDVQKDAWESMTQQEFWSLYGVTEQGSDFHNMWVLQNNAVAIEAIQKDFYYSDACGKLRNLILIGGLGDSVVDYEGEWSQFYGANGSNWWNYVAPNSDPYDNPVNNPQWTENDPKRFAAILYYYSGFGALGPDGLDNLFDTNNKDKLNRWLQNAYCDIFKHPEKYGLTEDQLKTLSRPALQNAVMKYFKDNMEELLNDFGYSEYEIAYVLANNAMQAANIVNGNASVDPTGAYGSYSGQDIEDYAQEFVDYVKKTYSDSEVLDALKDLQSAISDHSIKTMKGDEVNALMRKVLDAIDNTLKDDEPPEVPPTPEEINFDNIDYDNVECSNWYYETKNAMYADFANLKSQLKALVGDSITDAEFEAIWKQSFEGTYTFSSGTCCYYHAEEFKNPDGTIKVEAKAKQIVENFKKAYESIKDGTYLDSFNPNYKQGEIRMANSPSSLLCVAIKDGDDWVKAVNRLCARQNALIENDIIPKWPGESCGYTKEQWENALQKLKDRLWLALSAASQMSWHGLDNDEKEQQDEGNNFTFFKSSSQSTARDHNFTTSSPTGLYISCDEDNTSSGQNSYNEYYFRYDANKLWELFKSYL